MCRASDAVPPVPMPAVEEPQVSPDPDWQPFHPPRAASGGTTVTRDVAPAGMPGFPDPDAGCREPAPEVPEPSVASAQSTNVEASPDAAFPTDPAAGSELWRLRLRRLAERCEALPAARPDLAATEGGDLSSGSGQGSPLPRLILSSLRPLARLLAEGEAATDLVLTSEELGPLRFRIRTATGGGLALHVEAARAATLTYLRDHAGDLAAVLADLGLSGARLTWGRLSAVEPDAPQAGEGSAADIVLSALPPAPAADALDILL